MCDVVVSSEEDSSDTTDDDFDVFITLGRSYKPMEKTRWKFPNTKMCPICQISCSSRLAAIKHFRLSHAKTSIMCTICNTLFHKSSDLMVHYYFRHPNTTPPKLTHVTDQSVNDVNENVEKEKEIEMIDEENDFDDLITLNSNGIETQWRFPPNMNYCPVLNCRIQFGIRYDAVQHYKKRHANQAILCNICNKPISTKSTYEFKKHYSKLHPNTDLPYGLTELPPKPCGLSNKKKKVKVAVKNKNCKPAQTDDAKRNSKETVSINSTETSKKTHTIKAQSQKRWENHQHQDAHFIDGIQCPLKACNFEANQLTDIRSHWNEAHGEYDFPEIRTGIVFTYRTIQNDNPENFESNASSIAMSPEVSARNQNTTQSLSNQHETSKDASHQNVSKSSSDLLTPLRMESDDQFSSDSNGIFKCTDCRYTSKFVFALKKHRQNKHQGPKKTKTKKESPYPRISSSSDTDNERTNKDREFKRRRLIKKHARSINKRNNIINKLKYRNPFNKDNWNQSPIGLRMVKAEPLNELRPPNIVNVISTRQSENETDTDKRRRMSSN
ncbi:uncharacterized protein LOC116344008 isoform X3 [Contarinia nasturtii]|uniref:uncharacterized protein LOC116344008 isoform X3 n=1 Tax=Contarinia nasturtii TaxID=265458 RepID=UPI0012D38B07|nr:uncharacterized protein LOC116344008 isoform X3 [Contarinia nasturtii]